MKLFKKKRKKKKTPLYLLPFKSQVGFFSSLIFLFLVALFGFQIFNKPAELLALAGISTKKTPGQTWAIYKSEFINHSTEITTPTFLASLAQIESAGDPFATPEWQIKFSASMMNIFSPASSSVGLYQFTNGTYQQAKNYCIQYNKVVSTGPWHQLNSCWFNSLYLRTSASDSIEMASAFLTQKTLELTKNKTLPLSSLQKIAAITHLCGEKVSQRLLKNGLHIPQRYTCGSHHLKSYLHRLSNYNKVFKQLYSRIN